MVYKLRPATLWLLALGLLGTALFAAGPTVRREIGSGQVAALTDGRELFLEAEPLQGEGLLAFTRRLTGGEDAADAISAANRNPRRLLSDIRYRVPYDRLKPELQVAVIQALFPDAQERYDSWVVTVPEGFRELRLTNLTAWLTGDVDDSAAVGVFNDLSGVIREGQTILFPRGLLKEAFRPGLPAAPPPETVMIAAGPEQKPEAPVPGEGNPPEAPPTPTAASGLDPRLTYDDAGQVAVYRLKQGEALYSAVVVRFIGAVRAKEVNALADELAQLNGIRDVRDMPVGQPIRIPFDLLLPELLPPSDPRRQEWEKDRAASSQYSNTVRASRLEGITVILDAGHGGEDPGTNHEGLWESVYVYDVMVRVKRLLEATTAAEVIPTTVDDARGYSALDRDVLPRSRRHRVLTHPAYPIRDARVSAHLRWYLANSLHRKAQKVSRDPAKSIFLSIHADSLHHSLRGAMVYVPSTSLTKGSFGKNGTVYTSRREVKEARSVSFSWKERTRSEGLSRQFADKLLGAFRRHTLAVHPEKPVRDRIIRCRRCSPFVPAVVRYNEVPTKLLLEICNMNNPEDRTLLKTAAFRQRIALAIVDGILDYYGQPALEPPQRVADSP